MEFPLTEIFNGGEESAFDIRTISTCKSCPRSRKNGVFQHRNIGVRREMVGRISLTQNLAEAILQPSTMGSNSSGELFEPFYRPG